MKLTQRRIRKHSGWKSVNAVCEAWRQMTEAQRFYWLSQPGVRPELERRGLIERTQKAGGA
jgi:hypothetical protein